MDKLAMVLAASVMTLVDTAGAAAMPVALDAGNPAELGVRRGPGCRAHPESKWCARHYARLGEQRPRPAARHAMRHAGHDTRIETADANRQFVPPPPAGYAPPPPASYGPPPPPSSAYAAGTKFRGGYAGGGFVAAIVALGLVALGIVAIAHNDRNDRPNSP